MYLEMKNNLTLEHHCINKILSKSILFEEENIVHARLDKNENCSDT